MTATEMVEPDPLRAAKDLASGAVGGIAQVLLGEFCPGGQIRAESALFARCRLELLLT